MDISQMYADQTSQLDEFWPYIAVWRWLLVIAILRIWDTSKQFMRNPSIFGGIYLLLLFMPSIAGFHILFNRLSLGFRLSSIFAMLSPLLIFLSMLLIYRFAMNESLKTLTMNLIFGKVVDFTFPSNYYKILKSPDASPFFAIYAIRSKNNVIKLFGFKQLQRIFDGTSQERKPMFSLSRPGGHPRNWTAIRDASIEMIQQIIDRLQLETRCRTIRATTQGKAAMTRQNEVDADFIKSTDSLDTSSNSTVLNESYQGRQCLFLPPTLKPRSAEQFLPEIEYQKTRVPFFVKAVFVKIGRLFFITTQIISSYESLCALLAVKSLSSMIMCSLKEDEFGVVQKDLKSCLSSLTRLSLAIDAYMRASRRTIKTDDSDDFNIRMLDLELANSLKGIRSVLGEYLNDMGLHPIELEVFRVLV